MCAAHYGTLNPEQNRALAPGPKKRILLENYSLLGDVQGQTEALVEHYNDQR